MRLTILTTMILFGFFSRASQSKNPIDTTTLTSVYDIQINSLQGDSIDLSSFKGKKILFVNVASKCGYTKQYKGLQELNETHGDSLVIIGVPCNQFGFQEPGDANKIESFCTENYGVTFTMTEKVKVKGGSQHPLYAWLTKKAMNGVLDSNVKWNFQKYLVDEEGKLLKKFSSSVEPMSVEILEHL